MHISWLGGSALKIQTRPLAEDVVVVLNPYKPETGDFPRSITSDIVIGTLQDKNLVTITGSPFILTSPGECETKGVLITAAASQTPGQTIVRLDTEGMSIGFLGTAEKVLSSDELDVVSGVDILCIPVGGKNCYDAETAVKVVNAIEPRVIIPIAFQSDNDPNALDAGVFLRAIGLKAEPAEKKVIFKKKDLPTEEMKVILFEKE